MYTFLRQEHLMAGIYSCSSQSSVISGMLDTGALEVAWWQKDVKDGLWTNEWESLFDTALAWSPLYALLTCLQNFVSIGKLPKLLTVFHASAIEVVSHTLCVDLWYDI